MRCEMDSIHNPESICTRPANAYVSFLLANSTLAGRYICSLHITFYASCIVGPPIPYPEKARFLLEASHA